MMRPRPPSDSDEITPDNRWDALASLWFMEPGHPLDLHTAASIGDVDGVKQFISKGHDLNALNTGGWTPLMYGAYLGHEEVCQLLILFMDTNDRSIIDRRSRDRNQTALMFAASCGNENIVALLLKNGASLDAMDNRYRTPLYYATDCNHAQIVRQLLVAGANPNASAPPDVQSSDNRFLSPFELACSEGLDNIVQYFLQCGAAENHSMTESARALAIKNERMKVVGLIDNYQKSGVVGLKFDDRLHRARGLLDGPNAISSLMKLQCKLNSTPGDSDSHLVENTRFVKQRQNNQPTSQQVVRQQSVDDYEKTLTVEQEKLDRPMTIEELMKVLQLEKYLDVFKERDVDLEKLLKMNGEDLKEIGIKLFGPRKKILNAIERWDQNVPLTGIL